MVYLPGLGPHSTGRTRGQRLLQRFEVLGLARPFDVWLVGRRTPVSPGSSIADLAAEHASAIRGRFDHPVDVVGESTGGSIALRLALDHPDVVKRLVLVSAAARLRESGEKAQARAADRVRAGRPRAAAAIVLGTTSEGPIRRRLLSFAGYVLGRVVIGDDDGELVRIMDAEDGFDLGRELGEVTAPTLLIGGGRDGYYSPQLLGLTAARMPDARHVELPRKGHLSAIAEPRVWHLIRDHLRPDARS
ncbi:MAG: alpha/beta hydrolase [Acidobacteria bacterium]|nr:alpha/beta hydrolase [Acidobacteriota bacterium]